jgi:phosphatidylglycerol:prolipoprotein diacylglycerol transferase
MMESLINTWQHLPFHINPNIFTVGSFQLRYYSMMYIVAFIFVYAVSMYRIKTEQYDYTSETLQDYLVWAMLGVIIGARLGEVFIYNFTYFMHHPLEIFLPFSFSNGIKFTGISGMSYHGGVVGVILVSILFLRKRNINFWNFADLIVPSIALGYTFGRIGNFINGELWGRVTTVPWGMYFPFDQTQSLRHPSQLYEALSEGLFLFVFLWLLRKKPYGDGYLLGLYIFGYGFARFLCEFFREPDYMVGPISIGQVLCALMMAVGLMIFFWRKKASAATP